MAYDASSFGLLSTVELFTFAQIFARVRVKIEVYSFENPINSRQLLGSIIMSSSRPQAPDQDKRLSNGSRIPKPHSYAAIASSSQARAGGQPQRQSPSEMTHRNSQESASPTADIPLLRILELEQKLEQACDQNEVLKNKGARDKQKLQTANAELIQLKQQLKQAAAHEEAERKQKAELAQLSEQLQAAQQANQQQAAAHEEAERKQEAELTQLKQQLSSKPAASAQRPAPKKAPWRKYAIAVGFILGLIALVAGAAGLLGMIILPQATAITMIVYGAAVMISNGMSAARYSTSKASSQESAVSIEVSSTASNAPSQDVAAKPSPKEMYRPDPLAPVSVGQTASFYKPAPSVQAAAPALSDQNPSLSPR